MNMDNTNKWFALLANIGVISGIIFLAFELQQNNEYLEAQSRFNYYQTRIAQGESLLREGDIFESIIKQTNGEELSTIESMRLNTLSSNMFIAWEYEYGEYLQGRLSVEEFNASAKMIIFQNRNYMTAWKTYKETAPSYFVKFMEENIVNE